MRFFVFVVGIIGMLASSAVAQSDCVKRCNEFYEGCRNAEGTHEYCDALRNSCLTGC
ncbi:hypothetical protein OQA88_7111 [Cercophora sp. LCS_1]